MKKLVLLFLFAFGLPHIPILEAQFFSPTKNVWNKAFVLKTGAGFNSLLTVAASGSVPGDSAFYKSLTRPPYLQTNRNFAHEIRIKQGISFGEIGFKSSSELVYSFGPNDGSSLRFRYVSDPLTDRFANIMSVIGDSIRNTGKVQIGTSQHDRARLNVFSDGVTNVAGTQTQGISLFVRRKESTEYAEATFGIYCDIFGGNDARAIFAKSMDAPVSIGVRAAAENSTTVGYGLRGSAKSSTGIGVGISGEVYDAPTQYAVYGTAATVSQSFAGYFNGNVAYTGSLTYVSDQKLKDDIHQLEASLAKVLLLRPSSYQFKDKRKVGMNLDGGLNYGFIAQEVEKVLPELVSTVAHPSRDEENEGGLTVTNFKGVKYLQFIPLLTAAIQEQHQIIEEQGSQIAALEDKLENLQEMLARLQQGQPPTQDPKSISFPDTFLFQNEPNPFSNATTIRYRLPENFQRARIYIFDMRGRQVQVFDNLKGKDRLEIQAASLEAGMYLYSLVIDGEEIATKRMIFNNQ